MKILLVINPGFVCLKKSVFRLDSWKPFLCSENSRLAVVKGTPSCLLTSTAGFWEVSHQCSESNLFLWLLLRFFFLCHFLQSPCDIARCIVLFIYSLGIFEFMNWCFSSLLENSQSGSVSLSLLPHSLSLSCLSGTPVQLKLEFLTLTVYFALLFLIS